MSTQFRSGDDMNDSLDRLDSSEGVESSSAVVIDDNDVTVESKKKKQRVNRNQNAQNEEQMYILTIHPSTYDSSNAKWQKVGGQFRVLYNGNPHLPFKHIISSLITMGFKQPFKLYMKCSGEETDDNINNYDVILNEIHLSASIEFYKLTYPSQNIINIKAMPSATDSSPSIVSAADTAINAESRTLGEKLMQRMIKMEGELKRMNKTKLLEKKDQIKITNKENVEYTQERLKNANKNDFKIAFLNKYQIINFYTTKQNIVTVRNSTGSIIEFLENALKSSES